MLRQSGKNSFDVTSAVDDPNNLQILACHPVEDEISFISANSPAPYRGFLSQGVRCAHTRHAKQFNKCLTCGLAKPDRGFNSCLLSEPCEMFDQIPLGSLTFDNPCHVGTLIKPNGGSS
jgi:hypothetical protein